MTLVAGNGIAGFSGDNGPATSAQLGGYFAGGIAVDSAGNLYIADTDNFRVRRVSNGVITTVAGNGTRGHGGDNGPALNAQLDAPTSVAVDSTGNLYIADPNTNRVRKVSNGVITTVAGNGIQGFSGDDGPATSAQLDNPLGVAVDSAGNLYIADSGNSSVRKVFNSVITTVVGNGTAGFSGDNGAAASAQLSAPPSIAVDSAGNLYIVDSGNRRIRKVSNGVITTVAGGGSAYPGDNGPALNAQLSYPLGIAPDAAGNLYIADDDRIRMVSNGAITTVAGNGTCCLGGDNGPATSAQLSGPGGVAVDAAGSVYIADFGNLRVRKVSNGVITSVAGATGYDSRGVAVDFEGNLFIGTSRAILKISNGVATPVTGVGAGQGVGPGVAVDSAGNLYIADTDNNLIREVSSGVIGVITTVAGSGTRGFSGDNGPATDAALNSPTGVAVDSSGSLYIADSGNNRIRMVSNGAITTVAGDGIAGSYGNNIPAIIARFATPTGVAVDLTGNLYIADFHNRLVRKVSNGVITTVAGNGIPGFSGDGGPATNAQLSEPYGLAVDSAGKVYVADLGNRRIRLLTPSSPPTPSISATAVKNAASNLSGPIAPGEIVVVTGSGLGPSQITSAHVGNDGLYDSQLAGTSVQFNGIPAPMIYTSATQVAAVVPYGVNGTGEQVAVTYQGQTSAPVTVALAPSAPGLFTLDSNGKGQAAAVNQNGSTNTASTPAPVGSIISLYATGEGQTSPPGADGKPATTPLPKPNLPVSVTIGGQTLGGSQLQYVGGAPGEVAGVMQINVQIPSGITPGNAVPIVIQVGSAISQAGVIIAVSGSP